LAPCSHLEAPRRLCPQQGHGLFALPNILIFQMLLPLVSPFIDMMFLWAS